MINQNLLLHTFGPYEVWWTEDQVKIIMKYEASEDAADYIKAQEYKKKVINMIIHQLMHLV